MKKVAALLTEAELHQQAGRLNQARDVLCRALERDSANPEVYLRLALLLHQAGQSAVARELLQQAVQLAPHRADLVNNLAALAHHCGDLVAAEAGYRQALTLQPDYVDALSNLGAVLLNLDRASEAEPYLRRAVELCPDHVEALSNLGAALGKLEQPIQAVEWHRRALALNPNHLVSYRHLENALEKMGDHTGAVECAEEMLRRRPSPTLELRRSLLLPPILQQATEAIELRNNLRQTIARLRQANFRMADPLFEINRTPFYLAYYGYNDRDILSELADLYLQTTPSLGWTAPHCRESRRSQPIRIGFISMCFYNHVVSKLTIGILKNIDRRLFRVILLFFPGKEDEITKQLQQSVDETVLLSRSLERTRQMIADQHLDVLVYPDIGMHLQTYLLALSRLAPVQCTTWGHPVTTGIPNMDYYISSIHLEPNDAETHYSEQLIRLQRIPVCFSRPTLTGLPRTRQELGLPEQGPIYLCPQSLFKIHPDFDAILRGILTTDPSGHVVFISDRFGTMSQMIEKRWQQTLGPAKARIRFVPAMNSERFLHLLAQADVMLDPLHFGGGNTTLEALALGTPIVTLPGEFMRGRVTDGCYRQMGYRECVVESIPEYVAKAVRLGTDPAYRAQVKQEILARCGVLYDNLEVVRELEDFFVWAVKQPNARRADNQS